MPLMEVDESSWVIIRVVTLHEDHYRAAEPRRGTSISITNRVSAKRASKFFQQWLAEYEDRLKRLPPAELQRHIPYVRAARKFWAQKAEIAVK